MRKQWKFTFPAPARARRAQFPPQPLQSSLSVGVYQTAGNRDRKALTMPQPPTAIAALERLGIDEVCDRLIDGQSYSQICKTLEISKSALARWLASDAERSARAAEALKQSAQGEDDKAELILLDKTMDVQRARELAFHYRWRARVRNPRDYGEKVQIDQTTRTVNLSEEEILRQREAIAKRLTDGAEGPADV